VKVLFVDHYYAPHLGGGEEYLLTVAQGLKNYGFDIYILALPDSALAKTSRQKGINTIEASFFTKNPLKDASVVRDIIIDLAPQIVNTHGYYSHLIGKLAASNIKNTKLVCTVHTEPLPSYSRLKFKLRGIFERATSKNVYYIAVSREIKRQLSLLGISEEKVAVIYPAYNENLVWQANLHSKKGFTFAAAGRLEKVKGFDVLIRAFKLIADQGNHEQLVIYGEGTQRRSLEVLIQKLKLANQILMPGYVPPEELYKEIHVFVSSSFSEGLPITLLNAAYLGIPCICTSAGGQVEIIEHEKYGLVVKPGDVDALASAMLFVCKNYEAALKMAKEAKVFTEERFSPEKLVRSHIELFIKLAGSTQ
jgi:glycosyltransferase involved in cell wall biosynthesis